MLRMCQHLLQSSNREAVSQDEATYRHVRWNILWERNNNAVIYAASDPFDNYQPWKQAAQMSDTADELGTEDELEE